MANDLFQLLSYIVLASLIATAILMFIAKLLKSIFLKNIAQDKGAIFARLLEIKEMLEKAKEKLSIATMVSYRKFKDVDAQESVFKGQLETIKNETLALSDALQELTQELVEKEKSKNNLLQTSSNNTLIIGELIAGKATLENEMSALQKDLNSSKSELITLQNELEMEEAQKEVLKELETNLENLQEQLSESANAYRDISRSFMELENQYRLLEDEYKRLIALNIKES